MSQPPPLREDGLQLKENRAFQERFWRLQRLGWAGFALLIALAVLGLTGSGGPFHRQEIALGPAMAEVPRVARWAAADEIVLRFAPAGAGARQVALGGGFLDGFALERVEPTPETARLVPGGQVLTFASDGGPNEVRLRLRPLGPGPAGFTLGAGGPAQPVRLFVLP